MPTPILVIIIGQVSSAPFSILVLDRFFTVLSFTHTRTHAHTRARARAYTHTHTHTHLSPFALLFFVFVRFFLHLQLRTNSRSLFSHGYLFKRLLFVAQSTTDFCFYKEEAALFCFSMARRWRVDFYHRNWTSIFFHVLYSYFVI